MSASGGSAQTWARLARPGAAPWLVAALASIAYANSFGVPFLLDDRLAVLDNESLRAVGHWLLPPIDGPTGARPLLNASFGLNYAWSGVAPWSYHLVNLALHLANALLLLGIARGALRARGVAAATADALALSMALLWSVLPVLTSSVSYLSQRAESLMTFCYLLGGYALIRGSTSVSRRWLMLAIAAVWCGMAVKENMVTAPVALLGFDAAFLAGDLHAALRQRWKFHAALALGWLLLFGLLLAAPLAARSVGPSGHVGTVTYLLTQTRALCTYLKLTGWPAPLVFDYGIEALDPSWRHALPFIGVLTLVAVGLGWALRRGYPRAAFLGGWFFVVLAPASSVIPVQMQPIAENRVYLAAIAPIALAIHGLWRVVGARAFAIVAGVAVAGTMLTAARNVTFRDELRVWADTVAKQPGNARAHYNFANTLAARGRVAEAIAAYRAAIRIRPGYAEAHNNLGAALGRVPGAAAEAESHLRTAIEQVPTYFLAHYNLGLELAKDPARHAEAVAALATAVKFSPRSADAHYELARELQKSPERLAEAIAHYEQAARCAPTDYRPHNNLGGIYVRLGRPEEARREFRTAVRLDPLSSEARHNLAQVEEWLQQHAP